VDYVGCPATATTPRGARSRGGLRLRVHLHVARRRRHGARFVEALDVFTHMTHLGDVRSLVLHPASTSHAFLTEAERPPSASSRARCASRSASKTSPTSSATWAPRSRSPSMCPSRWSRERQAAAFRLVPRPRVRSARLGAPVPRLGLRLDAPRPLPAVGARARAGGVRLPADRGRPFARLARDDRPAGAARVRRPEARPAAARSVPLPGDDGTSA
jgi:hypothetical protein